MTGAILKDEDENCLEMPASRDTEAGLAEASGRRKGLVIDRGDARVNALERRVVADSCLEKILKQADMSQRTEGSKEGNEI